MANFLYHKNMLMKYIEKQMVVMQLKYPFKKWWNITSVNDNFFEERLMKIDMQ